MEEERGGSDEIKNPRFRMHVTITTRIGERLCSDIHTRSHSLQCFFFRSLGWWGGVE